MGSLPFAVALVGVLIAACHDLWKFRLHNLLTFPLLLSGLVYHVVVGGASGLAGSVLGVLVGGLPFMAIYAKGGMGAGDIKLLAGVGAWLGPWAVLHVLIVSGLATGCYSAGIWAWKRNQIQCCSERGDWAKRLRQETGACSGETSPDETGLEEAWNVIDVLNRPDRRAHAVPFGAMVALGVIVTALWID
jgi:Flp pilus assembly protein protease CpaA